MFSLVHNPNSEAASSNLSSSQSFTRIGKVQHLRRGCFVFMFSSVSRLFISYKEEGISSTERNSLYTPSKTKKSQPFLFPFFLFLGVFFKEANH